MLHYLKTHWKIIASLCLSFFLYLSSLLIVRADTQFLFRWYAFWIHIVSIGIILLVCVKKLGSKKHLEEATNTKELLFLCGLVFIVETVNLLYLQQYPFVGLGDDLRDGGLDALRITNGIITNFFGYGNYNGYGEIVPVITSFFYQIFGGSVLTYRVPAAIVSSLDVILLYFLLKRIVSRQLAFIGGVIYATIPLHLYYARSEVVVAFDSFWTTALLFCLYLWIKKKSLFSVILLGTIAGFASNFHTSVRIVAIIIGVIMLAFTSKNFFMELSFAQAKKLGTSIFFFILFFLVGFGPMIFFSNPSTFSQNNRFIYDKNALLINYSIDSKNKYQTLYNNYIKSLMVFGYEPTTSHYPDHKPIFPFPIFLLFLVGCGFIIFLERNIFFYVLIFLLLLLPFTNSAMTDWINADHRLVPLLPIAVICVVLGFGWILEKIKNKFAQYIAIGLLLIYVVLGALQFFKDQPANLNFPIHDYLAMHTINFLRSDLFSQNLPKNLSLLNPQTVCIAVSPSNYIPWNYLQYKEEREFFLPNLAISIASNPSVSDNEAYVFLNNCPSNVQIAKNILNAVSCNANDASYFCPIGFNGNIIIHY